MEPGEIFERIYGNEVEAVVQALAARPALAAERDPLLGSTPLVFAAHRGQVPIVEALLAAGADVHARELVSDSTALHWAAEGGHRGIVERLLGLGAELELRDGWHRLTPLGWATVVVWAPRFHEERPATAAALLAAGARLDLFVATVLRRHDAMRELAAADAGAVAARLGFVDDEMTPLLLAVQRGLAAETRLLVELGSDVAARSASGLTALALATAREAADEGGASALAALLREAGAADDAACALLRRDRAALAALVGAADATRLMHLAAREGWADGIEVLAAAGGEVGVRRMRLAGETPAMLSPLHVAAEEGHADAVRALLAAGAAPSPGADDGTPTPLHLAAGGGHVAAVRALVEGGADVEARDAAFGATPAGWAEFGGKAEVVGVLRGAGKGTG